MKYKVGDIVKLRDDLEVGKKYGGAKVGGSLALAIGKKGEIKGILTGQYHIKFSSKHGGYHFVSDEMIEGLWEECKSTEQVSKSEDSSVNSSVKKYKLIDILNKIANGELKEGTKVVRKEVEGWGNLEYTYINGDLEREGWNETIYLYEEMYGRHLNEEVELIEPNDFPDVGKMAEPTECEHEWKIGGIRDTIDPLEVVAFQHCEKCGMTKIMETKKQENHKEAEHFRDDTKMIEPTDNTKIEELDILEIEDSQNIDNIGLANSIGDLRNEIREIQHKLNEVIRKLNKED